MTRPGLQASEPRPLRVLIACDKFKGSLTSRQVLDAIAAGIRQAAPEAAVRGLLVADGGDGTLDAVCNAGFTRVPVQVTGPTGEQVRSAYAVRDGLAVVELADACGLARLPGGALAPMTASSRGVGEGVRAALDAGYRNIVLAVGGSASTDGGRGMLEALGVRFLDAEGNPLRDGSDALTQLHNVDVGGLHPGVRETAITLASDVTNPLLGERGAVAVFAEQKGAGAGQRAVLEQALTHYADVVERALGVSARNAPGAGAAGGVGFAALAVLGATMQPGAEFLVHLLDLTSAFHDVDLVITGEGSLDEQTLMGKTPSVVAQQAAHAGVPVMALCGRNLLSDEQCRAAGFTTVHALTELEPDESRCIADAAALLQRLAARTMATIAARTMATIAARTAR